MSIVVAASTGPKLEKTEKSVHIIKLSEETALAGLSGHPSQHQVLSAAAKHVGTPKKTDIVVFEHKPWHVVNGELRAHPQVHIDFPETILALSFAAQDKAVWWSEQPFTITGIERSPHYPPVHGSPNYPFSASTPPFDARPEQDQAGQPIFVVRTTPIVKESIGQRYKINFFMGEDVDPDMSCTP